MIHRLKKNRRLGGTMFEAALVYPVLAMFLVGTLMMGMGVCAFQQIASLSREGARWASVHGANYATVTGNAMATPSTVYNTAILPMAAGLDTTQLSYSVTWSANGVPNTSNPANSTVTVTVNYKWYPVGNTYFGMNTYYTLSSTSVMPMSF
jgi:hypothetical protein